MAIDPRANSPVQLAAPHPLTHISRKALKRVLDWLPPPTECPYCTSPVKLVLNSEIYGRPYGEWPYAYLCGGCKAYVGVHKHTDIPLGTLACYELREARKSSKSAFHDLQSAKGWTRNQAYSWLAVAMALPKEQTHFGWFDLHHCAKASKVCTDELSGVKF